MFRQVWLTIFVFSICSTYILITPAIEQMLYGWYLFGVQTGEWGHYEALTPTEKLMIWLRRLRGGLVGEWMSFGVVYLTSVMVVVFFDNRFVFSAPRMYMYQYC